MEPKKNPDQDVHRRRSTFFFLGLLISIGCVLTAFEWETAVRLQPPRTSLPDEAIYILPELIQLQPTAPDPAEPAPKKPVLTPILVENAEPQETAVPAVDLEPSEPLVTPIENPFVDVVDTATYFAGTAEFAPQPVGGFEAFYRMVQKELKYPRAAVRQEVSGKVYVEFVVSTAGVPQSIRIVKGIGSGCDEEAVRVISLSRWEAGRQRGKHVKVRMVLPIQFVIR
jgi:protein TonB